MGISSRAIFLLFGTIAALEYGEGDQSCAVEGTCSGDMEGDAAVESNGTAEASNCTDDHENCDFWAGLEPSECDENPRYMKKVCRKSCNFCDIPIEEDLEFDLGESQTMGDARPEEIRDLMQKTVEYMRNEVLVDPKYENVKDSCKNKDRKCASWAVAGECKNNPSFMSLNCAPVCQTCGSLEELDLGEIQTVEGSRAQDIRELIEKTNEYMRNKVFVDPKYEKVKDSCKNRHHKCALWAVAGECENNPSYMSIKCAPVCQTCEKIDYSTRCPMDNVGPDAFGPGDVNRFFEEITTSEEYKKYNPQILSRPTKKAKKGLLGRLEKFLNKNKQGRNEESEVSEEEDYPIGPWVVTLDDFVSSEECDRLIELGAEEGYARSVEVGKAKYDGTHEQKIHEGRTSTNAWCQNSCYKDPVAITVMDRIANLTGIPEPNAEYLQLLKYEVGEYYQNHHDYIPHQVDRQCGVRMLTVYIYLNDLEEGGGGGTSFTNLNLTVYPKRGRALIWPSVLDEDPNKKDNRTHHQALPVEKGIKYGANAWIHMRDYKNPNKNSCM